MTSASKKRHTKEAWQKIRSIAERALDLAAAEQARFVAERCAGDAEVEVAARRLLALDRETDPALDVGAAVGIGRARKSALPFHEPVRIGAYTLRRELGSGGMGSVWLAVQADGDFHRRVAIKPSIGERGTKRSWRDSSANVRCSPTSIIPASRD
jgi:hypothetical protein